MNNQSDRQMDQGYPAYPKYPQYPQSESSQNKPFFAQVLGSVLKRPWIVPLTVFVIIIPTLFYVFSLVPTYYSQATIGIEAKTAKYGSSGIESQIFNSSNEINFYLILLHSRNYQNKVRQEILENKPGLSADSLDALWVSLRASQRTDATNMINLQGRSYSSKFAQEMTEQAVETFEEMVLDLKRDNAKFIVEYIDKLLIDLNAKLADTEAEGREFLRQRGLTVSDVSEGMDSELRVLEKQLAGAETERDLAKMKIESFSDQIDKRFNSVSIDYESDVKRNKINELRKRLDQINNRISDSLDKDNSSVSIDNLQDERKKIVFELMELTRGRKMNGEVSQVSIPALETELQNALLEHRKAQTEYQYYKTAIENFLEAHPDLPKDILTYININRAKEVQKKTIDVLVEKRETSRIEMLSEVGGIRIIDPPDNVDFIPTKKKQITLSTAFFALLLGIGICFFIDFLDTTVQSEIDISERFNIPVFGSIPVLGAKSKRGKGYGYGYGSGYGYGYGYGNKSGGYGYGYGYEPDEEDEEETDITGGNQGSNDASELELDSKSNQKTRSIHSVNETEKTDGKDKKSTDSKYAPFTLLKQHKATSPIAEAYRSIKTSIQFLAEDQGFKSFVVSSSVASEGKTVTTFNLGTSFAQGDLKTLVIDADLRRSSVHKLAEIDRTPGLTNVLLKETDVESVIMDIGVKNQFVLPAGKRVNNPAELLSSHAMETLLEKLESKFDIILFDAPPISPCMDSRYLAKITGGMIIIARAEMTKLPVLEHCISLCRRINVNVHGAIINHASFRYGYGYYYFYQRYNPYGYYYRGYEYYYSTDSESGEKVKKKRKKTGRRRSSKAEKEEV